MRAGDEVDQSVAKRLELYPIDYAAMNHLMSGARQLGPVELGALLGMTSGSATGLVDRLETAGHVRRQPHPSDRRRLVVAPTESATRTVIDVLRPMLDALDALGGEFREPNSAPSSGTCSRPPRGYGLRGRSGPSRLTDRTAAGPTAQQCRAPICVGDVQSVRYRRSRCRHFRALAREGWGAWQRSCWSPGRRGSSDRT